MRSLARLRHQPRHHHLHQLRLRLRQRRHALGDVAQRRDLARLHCRARNFAMKKKRTAQFGSLSLQLVFGSAAVCSMITGTLLAFFHPQVPTKASQRTLTFAQRVAYQRAIEDVYWRHRIWPKENSKHKPSLDEVMSDQQIERRVEDYLRDAQALEDYWQRPITHDQLQAEIERIASHTKQPEVLRELFAALGDDPFVIAECLARPVLAERLLTNLNAHYQSIHGELKERPEYRRASADNRAPYSMEATGASYRASHSLGSAGWMHRRNMDNHQHHQRTCCASLPHSSVDWE